jgi:hypothetical protein
MEIYIGMGQVESVIVQIDVYVRFWVVHRP